MSDEHETPTELAGEQPVAANLPAKIPLEADDRGILPIIPRNTEEAARYASALIRAGIVPDSYRVGGKKDGEPDAPLILAGILKALEVGLAPQTGLGTIYPIAGRFTIYGDGAIALIQRNRVIAKHTEREIGSSFSPETEIGEWPDDYGWAVSYWRVGQEEPYVGRFTVKDAKRAGLWMSSYRKPWIMYPRRMLFNRARAFALRDGFADCLLGLGIREEVEDMTPPVEDGGTLGTRHLSALDDEPETAALPAIEHHPEPTAELAPDKQPEDLFKKDF